MQGVKGRGQAQGRCSLLFAGRWRAAWHSAGRKATRPCADEAVLPASRAPPARRGCTVLCTHQEP